jgi:RNA polymerase-associated protein RTF1
MEKSRLNAEKKVAYNRQDWEEYRRLEEQLNALDVQSSPTKSKPRDEATNGTAGSTGESERDRLARVNERNRKANLESVRKAELAEAERKRLKRKLGAGTPVPGTPGVLTPLR